MTPSFLDKLTKSPMGSTILFELSKLDRALTEEEKEILTAQSIKSGLLEEAFLTSLLRVIEFFSDTDQFVVVTTDEKKNKFLQMELALKKVTEIIEDEFAHPDREKGKSQ